MCVFQSRDGRDGDARLEEPDHVTPPPHSRCLPRPSKPAEPAPGAATETYQAVLATPP